MIKKYRKNKLKGSVLYTVVAVMMIMTVFVFAALTLASAANRRAFNSYANNQTQYTARSVVETVWEQIESIPEIGKKIDVLSKSGVGSELKFEVELPDKSMGEVVNDDEDKKPTVTYLGKGIDYGYDIDDNFYKLSVTVRMLGQENTLAGYFLPERIENPSFEYALVSLDSGSLDNAAIYGGASYGVGDYGNNGTNNNTVLRSPIQMNGDLNIDQCRYNYIEQKSGMFVNGDLSFGNSGNVNSVISGTLLKYRELPYLYVDKSIHYSNTSVTIGSDNSPVIIMADSIQGQNISASNDYSIYGDVYLYNTSTPSTLALSGKSGIKKIGDYTNKLKKQDNAMTGLSSDLSYKCGNLYSFGEINTYGYGVLANNVVADTLNLNNSAITTGAVVTKKLNFYVLNGNTFDFKNGLFVYPENLSTISKNVKLLDSDVPVKSDNMCYPLFDASQLMLYQYNTDSIKVNWSTDEWWLGDINPNNVSGTLIDSYGNNIAILKNFNMSNRSFTLEFVPGFIPNGWVWLNINGLNGHEIKISNYDLNTKFQNSIDYIRSVNDVAFNNNGNIIYIDDIDKSVKIEKFSDVDGYTKLKISKADLTGVDEGNEIGLSYTDIGEYYYDSQYADFLRAVVDTVTFPESMKKANVLKSNGGFVDDNFLKMEAGKSKIAQNAKIEVDNAFSQEHLDLAKSKVYTHDTLKDPNTGKYITITESCTLKGEFYDTINFKPDSSEIYVLLDGNFRNQKKESDFIVVDDNNGQNRVNFLIPKGQNVKIIGNVLTKYYQDYLSKYEYCPECNIIWEDTDAIKCSHPKINAPIFQNPIVKDKISGNLIVDQQQIPGINFYMEYDENFENETDESKLPIIQFSEAHVSAYILAPTGYISLPNGGIQKKYTYKNQYSIVECGDFGNAIIGAVVSKKVNLQNICLFSYVNPNPKLTEDTEEELHYKARCIYYQSY